MNYLYTQITENGKTVTYFEISDYITLIFLAFLILGFIFFIIKVLKDAAIARKKALLELENPLEEPAITEVDARVLKKECFVKTYGIRLPESRREFYITFSTFTGEIKRYSVSEELYLSVDEGTVGTIAIVDNNFFDFYFEK